MVRKHEEAFDVPPDALYEALVRYVRSKPEYYENVVEDRAAHELRAKLTIGYFVYHAQVRFVVTARSNGSALAMRVQTSPLFLIDPLDFWGRYCRRVTGNVRAQARAA